VSDWIDRLKAGERAAAERLWERYFRRLVQVARRRLWGSPCRAADEEDVALSAFASFCRGAERGRFPQLRDRNDLWTLLILITTRKALDLIEHEGRQKRGGMHRDVSLPNANASSTAGPRLERILRQEPGPELIVEMAEECQRLLQRLGNETLRSVAVWKMQGYTEQEISAKLGCVPRSVRRKLQAIRILWSKEFSP
jgi:DNA-directed RNA polymerase specialized sigma24 family protein